ncbi:MAG: response regulator [Alphaproteobacteria bacterium]|nr:response regulator [Alphaproteobacteria bacterium]
MAGYDISKLKFLIVDDNKGMRKLVKVILKAFNVKNIIELETCEGALNEIRLFKPDIIICDWEMKPINGISFVKKIRTSNKSFDKFIPIIMLTGYSERKRVIEARDVGISEYLVKPISSKGLFSRIRSIIENPRVFVKTKDYFGPDRRRKQMWFKGEDRRHNKSKDIKAVAKARAKIIEKEKKKITG